MKNASQAMTRADHIAAVSFYLLLAVFATSPAWMMAIYVLLTEPKP